MSKTLGGGIPLAATITSSAIEADCVAGGFVHVTSHVADPLPAAAGLAVLEVIEEEHLVEQAQQRGRYLLERLRELQARHEQVGDVRGRGLLVGLELVEDRASRAPASTLGAAVTTECLRRGLSMNIARTGPARQLFPHGTPTDGHRGGDRHCRRDPGPVHQEQSGRAHWPHAERPARSRGCVVDFVSRNVPACTLARLSPGMIACDMQASAPLAC